MLDYFTIQFLEYKEQLPISPTLYLEKKNKSPKRTSYETKYLKVIRTFIEPQSRETASALPPNKLSNHSVLRPMPIVILYLLV